MRQAEGVPVTLRTIIDDNIPSRLELVSGFIAAAVKKLEALGLDAAAAFDLKLCLHEAVFNAVKHGNKQDSSLVVHVVVKMGSEGLFLEITDQGQGFDFSVIPDPTTEENIGKYHGRGIYLIKSMMDTVTFSNEGRTIKMFKRM